MAPPINQRRTGFRPDDTGTVPKTWPTGGPMIPSRPGRPGTGGNQSPGLMSPFFPGQLGLLANQMDWGFGGGQAQNRGLLNQIYSPVQMPQPFQYSQVGVAGQTDPKREILRKLLGQPEPEDPNKYSHPDPNPRRQRDPWSAR